MNTWIDTSYIKSGREFKNNDGNAVMLFDKYEDSNGLKFPEYWSAVYFFSDKTHYWVTNRDVGGIDDKPHMFKSREEAMQYLDNHPLMYHPEKN